MFALKTGQSGEAGAPRPAFFGLSFSPENLVLPRFLRRPARFVARLCDGEYAPPRHAGIIATAIFLSSSALYGAWLGGQIPAAAQAVTARLGFAVDQVRVSGNRETSEIDILERLDLDGWTSLIGFDAEAARGRIAQLPWVKAAAVRKVYPDALEVRIEEREPFAIWQHGSQLAVVERSGRVIAPFGGGRHAVLPLVIGYGAAEEAAGFVGKIRQHPELAARVKGFIRVAERRWDLRLENGITIRLPETGEDAAIAEVLRLDREDGLLSRDIAAVDLRLDDRLVIRLTPEAMERRTTLLAEQEKAAQKEAGEEHMSWLGGQKDASKGRSGIVTVLDVGSSKVCCVIARLRPRGESQMLRGRTHEVQVIGIGHQKSHGVKSGVVIDLNRAEHAIRLAVDAAERMAGLTVNSLIVNLTAGRLKSETYSATINLGGHEADAADIKRVLAAGAKQALKAEREVVHSLPVGFSLDGERGVRDPRGMVGDTLGVDMHVLTGDAAPLRNLELCINRSHLSVERMVATPYASGLAALVDDELEMGAACIDMGGGTTTISVFADGKFVHGDAIPVGGNHVTLDMAKGLSARLDHAERLKVMHGSALPGSADDRETVTIQPMSNDDGEVPLQVPRSVMTRIIRARVEETLEIIRDRLGKSGYGSAVGKRVVLTGGASQLAGLPEAARRILGRNVRIGRPLGVAGLPEAAKGPAFATAVGLMIYPQVASFESREGKMASRLRMTGTGGRFNRMSQWIRDSF